MDSYFSLNYINILIPPNNDPLKHLVILSSTINPRYLFVLPFTVASWKHLNTDAIVVLVVNEQEIKTKNYSRVAIELLEGLGAKIIYLSSERLSPVSLSQVSRLTFLIFHY